MMGEPLGTVPPVEVLPDEGPPLAELPVSALEAFPLPAVLLLDEPAFPALFAFPAFSAELVLLVPALPLERALSPCWLVLPALPVLLLFPVPVLPLPVLPLAVPMFPVEVLPLLPVLLPALPEPPPCGLSSSSRGMHSTSPTIRRAGWISRLAANRSRRGTPSL